ncbi:MAG TPA: hypothetical protein VHU80_23360 [Polyangiaceae bacterium]|jgi:hypothetical protein|nr:hypothetical protein [Polyangiaceae bacterium]
MPDGPPSECYLGTGTLPDGATCFAGTQCASGVCRLGTIVTPGGSGPFECGTCETVTPVGAECDAPCAVGSSCLNLESDVPGTTYRCVALHFGDMGDTCDEFATLCAKGLYCERGSRTCVPLRALGASCGSLWPTGCVAPNYCDGSPGTCKAPGDAGDDCSKGQPCGAGLSCDIDTSECAPVEWEEQGTPCDIGIHRCRSGDCQLAQRTTGSTGTCPFIAEDGGSCTDATRECDVGEICYHGACTNQYVVRCN